MIRRETVFRAVITFATVAMLLTLAAQSVAQEAPAAPAAPAAQTAPTSRPAGFDELVAQLGSDDWRVRDAAHVKIVKMGAAAAGAAMKEVADRAENVEVRQRAQAIVKEWAAADVTQGTKVTLKFKDANPADVYESLYKQAGAKLVTWPDGLFERFDRRGAVGGAPGGNQPPGVWVDLQNVPFWKAMIQLEKQTGLWVESFGGVGEMRLGRDAPRGKPFSLTGPFLVVADDTFGGRMIHRMKVYVEPRLTVLAHDDQPEIAAAAPAGAAAANAGGNLARQLRPRMRGRGRGGLGGNAFDVHLHQPFHAAGALKGTIGVTLLTRSRTVVIDKIAEANNVEKIVDGQRFLVNAMSPEAGHWFITVIVYGKQQQQQQDAAPGVMFKTSFTLTDANDRAFQLGGHSAGGGGGKWVAFTLNFTQPPNAGPPAKLAITTPDETQDVEIPFEFKVDN